MAGLFDIFSGNASPEVTQSLLGFGSGLLQGAGRPGVGFGQALAMGVQGLQQAQEQQRANQFAALRMRGLQAEMEDQDRKRRKEAEFEGALRDSVLTPEQQALAGGGGPTAANAVKIPQMEGGFDQATFLRKAMSIDPLRAMETAKLFQKTGPEYDTTPQILNGPNGPVVVQLSKTGAPRVLEGFTPREKAELVNLGGKSVAVNLADLKPGETFQRTMTPGEAASNQLGWANNAIARGQLGIAGERLKIDKQEAATRAAVGKAPTEFQGKSAAFGLRATEADKIISGLEGKYSPASINAKAAIGKLPLIGGMLEAGTNLGMSDAEQRAEQAQRDFVNAVLRQESGAAIGPDEFNNARKQYFPQPGDGKAVIAQKARNRALAIQGLQSNAGRAALTAPAGAQPAAAGGVKFLGFE